MVFQRKDKYSVFAAIQIIILGELKISRVAAEVTRLKILEIRDDSEPPHVGCYFFTDYQPSRKDSAANCSSFGYYRWWRNAWLSDRNDPQFQKTISDLFSEIKLCLGVA
jgi:hypothetical protein